MEYMTIFLTLFLVLISGASALAQKLENHDKIQPTQMGIVLVAGISGPIGTEKVEAAKKNGFQIKLAQTLNRYEPRA